MTWWVRQHIKFVIRSLISKEVFEFNMQSTFLPFDTFNCVFYSF